SAGGFSSPVSGWTTICISSTIWRRREGSMAFRLRISATWLTSILGMEFGRFWPHQRTLWRHSDIFSDMQTRPEQNEAQNQDELFDVVNEQDEVVRQATRGEVHRQRWLHRAVHVFVFDRQGRVFLQKRSMAKDTNPGCWSPSASGHVDAGEGYDEAALRELREEIGVELPAPPPRWLRLNACRETGREFVWIYRVEHEGPFRLNEAEIS